VDAAADGEFWLGTSEGHVVWGRPQGPWSELARPDGMTPGSFNTLAPATDGGAWIATSLGLLRWRPGVDAPDVCGPPLPVLGDAKTLDAVLSPDLDVDLYRLDVT
jgi:ligand-binding sensor domain-containing protein